VQKFEAPLENVTTHSLQALQACTLGFQSEMPRNDFAGAEDCPNNAITREQAL